MSSSASQLSSNWALSQHMIGGLLQAFLSLQLVSMSVSFDPGWLLFDPVLVQEVPLRTCLGRIFGAPASPLVRGDYFTKASLVIFLEKLSWITRPSSSAGDGNL